MNKIITRQGIVTYIFPNDYVLRYAEDGCLLMPDGRKIADHREGDGIIQVYSDVANAPTDLRGGWYNFNGSIFSKTTQHPDYID